MLGEGPKIIVEAFQAPLGKENFQTSERFERN